MRSSRLYMSVITRVWAARMASSTVVVSVVGADVEDVEVAATDSVVGAADEGAAVVSLVGPELEQAAPRDARVSTTAKAGIRLRIGLLTGSRVWDGRVLGKRRT